MNEKVKQEVEQIIKHFSSLCGKRLNVDNFKEIGLWNRICTNYDISEEFIREFQDELPWIYISQYQKLSEAFIREFQDKVDWYSLCQYQVLSEDFIREFKHKVAWGAISQYQKLSETFIREFQDKVIWSYISIEQRLSEEFIREFQDKLHWISISEWQNLSEGFILEFEDRVHWGYLSLTQNLSKEFVGRFQNKINYVLQDARFRKKSDEQKLQEVKAYAEKHNLKFDGTYLYAYREHDKWGRGSWNKTIIYDKIGKEYRDWHCNVDQTDHASFGLGIWPKTPHVNTKVKVHYKDWGCAVNFGNGKGRVWAFTLLGPYEEEGSKYFRGVS